MTVSNEQIIRQLATKYGFQDAKYTPVALDKDYQHLTQWLELGYQGDMDWMARNLNLRQDPSQLMEGTLGVISVRLDYLPDQKAETILASDRHAYVARYALGRDYHKMMRKRLMQLAQDLQQHFGEYHFRACVDSAPVLERAHAQNAGLGWIGKNTMLINKQAGSWFFLGELLTDLPLVEAEPQEADLHCGSCQRCIEVCPTAAIVAPNVLDARRCISYLTIENPGEIPLEFRKALGNRIYGCDDCQLFCPWTKFSKLSSEADFQPRHKLDQASLLDLWQWSEADFLQRLEGSAIRRIGYRNWLRNLAVALGNQTQQVESVERALSDRLGTIDPLLDEHISWALEQLATRR